MKTVCVYMYDVMSMKARMSLSNVSQEYTFCACTVLGKLALFGQNTV